MSDASIRIDRNGRVGELVLSRPDRRNALDYATVLALVAALEDLENDDDVGAVLIHGDGPSFCAGGDLAEFQNGITSSAYEFHTSGQAWVDLMTVIPRMRTPVVAAPHKHALAGGFGLVAAADIVIAAEGTAFGMSEIKIGLFPIVIYPTVARAIGPRAARELALSGRRMDAVEAQRVGLAHQIVPADELLTTARQITAEIASLGRHALSLGKWYMREVDDLPVEAGTALGQSVRGAFMSTPDFEEGLAAFFAKRAPDFHP
ncbi:enoyl-CoA hydratase [soil metagenome]